MKVPRKLPTGKSQRVIYVVMLVTVGVIIDAVNPEKKGTADDDQQQYDIRSILHYFCHLTDICHFRP